MEIIDEFTPPHPDQYDGLKKPITVLWFRLGGTVMPVMRGGDNKTPDNVLIFGGEPLAAKPERVVVLR